MFVEAVRSIGEVNEFVGGVRALRRQGAAR
jgi:hypothetical protein